MAKLATLNSIIVIYFAKTLIPNYWFENVFPTTLVLKSPNGIFIWYLGSLSNT
jgi:hypothetical protein